jgi:hypothetical protein
MRRFSFAAILALPLLAACSNTTAPRKDVDPECRSGYVNSGGLCVPDPNGN